MKTAVRHSRLPGVVLFGVTSLPMSAQVVAKPPVTTPSAGGNSFDGPGDVRYQADRDSQTEESTCSSVTGGDSMPRHAFGSLVVAGYSDSRRQLRPAPAWRYPPGCQLPCLWPSSAARFDHAFAAGCEQIVYYIVGGSGEITAGSKTAALHKDIAVFVPANLEFRHEEHRQRRSHYVCRQ